MGWDAGWDGIWDVGLQLPGGMQGFGSRGSAALPLQSHCLLLHDAYLVLQDANRQGCSWDQFSV